VLETALEEEMIEHLGHDKRAVEGRDGANSRNGKRTKTVVSDAVGPVQIEVPRDRDGSFEPVIVAKRHRRRPNSSRAGLRAAEVLNHIDQDSAENDG
jgi:transposase-like protein